MSKLRMGLLAGACLLALITGGALPATAQNDASPKATEVGVTPTEIHIAVAADVDNPFAPGLFQGAVDGVKAAAKYINSKAGGGGLAGRKLVVDFIDTHLNANDTRNATITACQNDLALVGGLMLFLTSVADIDSCPDQAGQATGIPNLTSTAVGIPETCSPMTFAGHGSSTDCSTIDDNPQTFWGNQGPAKWFVSQEKSLHGPMIVGNDTKDAERGGTILALTAQEAGIKPDQGTTVPRSGRDPQSAYTNVVQQMKTDGSNYSMMVSAASSALLLREEAALQGLDSSKVIWECTTCYGNELMTANADAFEGEWQYLNFLPFEETKYNKTLATFIKYVGRDNADQFAAYAFESTLAFAEAIKAVVAKDGVNGITRSSLIEGIKSLTDFDAGGMTGVHNMKTGRITDCFVMAQFQKGKWVRMYPKKKGTFDCKPANGLDLEANLLGR